MTVSGDELRRAVEEYFVRVTDRDSRIITCSGCHQVTYDGKLEHLPAYGTKEVCAYLAMLRIIKRWERVNG